MVYLFFALYVILIVLGLFLIQVGYLLEKNYKTKGVNYDEKA